MMLYRAEYYKQRQSKKQYEKGYEEWLRELREVENIAELNVLKNRNGALANIDLYFDAKFGRFTELQK